MSASATQKIKCAACNVSIQAEIKKMMGDVPLYYATCAICREKAATRSRAVPRATIQTSMDTTRMRIISALLQCNSLPLLHEIEAQLVGDHPPSRPSSPVPPAIALASALVG